MRTTASTAAVAVAFAFAGVAGVASIADAREPSSACDNGEVRPATTPLGVGARQAGDPYQDPQSFYVCSTSTAPGTVWVRADTTSNRAHVIVDGDSTNHTTPCGDGYVAARADADGVRLYRADDGDFSFVARERYAEDWARGTAGCVPHAMLAS